MSKVVAVIPSCRMDCLTEFLQAWRPFPWHETVVVWDGATYPVATIGTGCHFYDHADIEKTEQVLGHRLFSRGDSAIRSYGFLRAVKTHNATHVVTLDDDCYPENLLRDTFVDQHMANLDAAPTWVSSIPGVTVRGLPYSSEVYRLPVGVSMGLWTNHADVDAIHALMQVPESKPGFMPPRG